MGINQSVEQEIVAATSDVRPPQGEPRRSSATRSIIDSENLTKNSTKSARQHPQFIIEEEAPRNFTSRLKDRRHIILPILYPEKKSTCSVTGSRDIPLEPRTPISQQEKKNTQV
jgi:hypothetical protein